MSIDSNSNTLFHYTNTKVKLLSILKNGLFPNYCMEELPFNKIIGIPMISFCDIPLTRADVHRGKYGKFAIGLTKDWGKRNKLNPLLYLFSELYTATDFTTVQFWHGLAKKYNGRDKKGDIITNYNENEWRLLLPNTPPSQWFTETEYTTWRGDSTKPKPKSTFTPSTFDVNDIRYIIVEKESEINDVIEAIIKAKRIGGNSVAKDDLSQKHILLTKVISIEKLNTDI